MGRSKLPDAVKKMRGTSRKCREIDVSVVESNVVTELSSVTAPKHLNAEAKRIYKILVQQLFSMKMLMPIDEVALSIYCNAVVTIHKMQEALDKDGYVVVEKDEFGAMCKVSVNPAQKVLKDAINTANTIGSQFGWSPAARMKLVSMLANTDEKKNDFTDFTE